MPDVTSYKVTIRRETKSERERGGQKESEGKRGKEKERDKVMRKRKREREWEGYGKKVFSSLTYDEPLKSNFCSKSEAKKIEFINKQNR